MQSTKAAYARTAHAHSEQELQKGLPFVGKHLFEKLITARPPGFSTLCIS